MVHRVHIFSFALMAQLTSCADKGSPEPSNTCADDAGCEAIPACEDGNSLNADDCVAAVSAGLCVRDERARSCEVVLELSLGGGRLAFDDRIQGLSRQQGHHLAGAFMARQDEPMDHCVAEVRLFQAGAQATMVSSRCFDGEGHALKTSLSLEEQE